MFNSCPEALEHLGRTLLGYCQVATDPLKGHSNIPQSPDVSDPLTRPGEDCRDSVLTPGVQAIEVHLRVERACELITQPGPCCRRQVHLLVPAPVSPAAMVDVLVPPY